MTVSTTTNKMPLYACNGSTKAFAFTFKCFEDTDLRVILRDAAGAETVLTLNSDYSVTLNGDGTGTVTTLAAAAYASGNYLLIKRSLDQVQETDWPENDPFPAESHEDAADRLVMIVQEQQEQLDRCLYAPETDTATSLEIPNETDRASRFLAFNASGVPIAAATVTTDPVTTWAATLLDDASALEARGTLGLDTDDDVEFADITCDNLTATGTLDVSGSAAIGTSLTAATLTLASGAGVNEFSVDGTMAGLSDVAVPTELSVVEYLGRMLFGYAAGLEVSRDTGGGDPANDLAISPGACQDSSNTWLMRLTSALVKKGDATWAAGTAAGGMAAGLAKSADTWYHVHLLYNPTTGGVDAGFDTSAVAANLLADAAVVAAGFTKYRLVNSWKTEALTTDWFEYLQLGDIMYVGATVALDVDLAEDDGDEHTVTLTVPPDYRVEALINVNLRAQAGMSNGVCFRVYPTGTLTISNTDSETPLHNLGIIANASVGYLQTQSLGMEVITDTSQQINYRLMAPTGNSVLIKIATMGWRMLRNNM